MGQKKLSKAERTKQQIMDAAMVLFRSEGYEKTTMRAIAKQAEMSTGSTYYYFPTKEHLIHAFYEQTFASFQARAREKIADTDIFADRLRLCIQAQLEVSASWHEVSVALFRAAAYPGSPLSPFGEEAASVRDRCIELYEEVARGSKLKVSKLLQPRLGSLLWLFHMSIVLFWIYDTSPGQRRSYAFLDATVPLYVRLLTLSRLPPLRPVVRASLQLFDFFDFPGWISVKTGEQDEEESVLIPVGDG